MDFKKLLQTAKDKTKEYSEKAVDFSSKKLSESSLTLKKSEDVQKIILASENKNFKNEETWEEKTFTKHSIIIFGDEKSDFFKEALYILPVLATKGFTKNTPVKLAWNNIEAFDYKKYGIQEFPSLVLFENKEVKKVITGKENILKLVKTWNFDINELVEKSH